MGNKLNLIQEPYPSRQAPSVSSLCLIDGEMEIGNKRHAKVRKVRPDSIAFTLLLATMAALPPLAIDFYLSTLSVIGKSFGSSPAVVGCTISIFLGSTALSQLVFGPLSDRFGRRPVGIFGCTLFALAALGCALAHSMAMLLFCRFLQGVGAGAVLVLAFAIVRDLFSGSAANVRFAYVNATMAFVPVIAPVVGSLLYKIAWLASHLRGLCSSRCGIGGGLLFLVLRVSSQGKADRVFGCSVGSQLLPGCVAPFGVRLYSILSALTFGAMLAYVTGSSFVFVDLMGMTRPHFGIMLLITSAGIVSGSFPVGSAQQTRHVLPENLNCKFVPYYCGYWYPAGS